MSRDDCARSGCEDGCRHCLDDDAWWGRPEALGERPDLDAIRAQATASLELLAEVRGR